MSDNVQGKLQGKVAIVTGGSRGIGAAIAQKLSENGAKVAITYSNSAARADETVQGIIATGGEAIALKADSADAEAVRSVVQETVKRFGQLDILVNNAGIFLGGNAKDFDITSFDRMLDVNVKGPFVAIQESLKHLVKGGRIINIGSVMSTYSSLPEASVYVLTKAAIEGLTRGLTKELGPLGITVNTIQPGPIDTEMNPADGPVAEIVQGTIPVGRYGTVNEIANLALFLASPESSYITGASILADGGAAA